MTLERDAQRFVCRSLSLRYRGQNYPLKVRQTGLANGSRTYSVEINIGQSDKVVIDAADLAEGLREAETILPMAFAARRIPPQ